MDVIGDKAKEYIQKQLRFQVDYIRGIDCDEDEEDDKGKEDDGNKGKTPLPGDINFNHVPAIAKMDPSGYVYEAVPSNRLPGVTTTIYIKHEDDTVEEWDATEYGEVNPQLTNEYGEYGWDVPVGLWQVKYEKAGYVTAYSEWLPVPPPQLDVNMSKVRMEEPTVQDAQGYETGIEIVFDKYMDPSTMTATLINVTQDGTAVSGAITLQNEETDPLSGKSFVSNVRFVPDAPFTLGSEVKLTVVKAVKSYAGVEMTGDFVKTLSIGKEAIGINVTPELEILYNDATTIEVSVEPAEAAAGKRVLARSIAPSIVSVTSDATLDAQGRASLRINAELPGLALIEVSVEGTNLKAEVTVHVVQTKAVAEQTAKPTASIPSGSEVAPQTTVALSSATSGAAIRYTLDGTCPCDGVYLTYTLPIVISEHTVIKAIAVKDDMQESELATFEYFIREDGAPDPDPDEGGNGEGDPDNSDPGDDDTVGTEGVDNILSITPNPIRRSAYNDIIVRVPDNNIYEDYMLHVYTASGALIREIRLSGPNPPVGQLEKGLYIFRLSNKNGQTRLVQKMIVAD
ncbi:MAG: chitobiase/beta-hexosaminidase C-terminal domain-containing protein [Tannerellaceae bacterium]|nr:chitobiase/beta-hexosaminidase C-terminal domain-containing protein [Tannerellaceae bacterium]